MKKETAHWAAVLVMTVSSLFAGIDREVVSLNGIWRVAEIADPEPRPAAFTSEDQTVELFREIKVLEEVASSSCDAVNVYVHDVG